VSLRTDRLPENFHLIEQTATFNWSNDQNLWMVLAGDVKGRTFRGRSNSHAVYHVPRCGRSGRYAMLK